MIMSANAEQVKAGAYEAGKPAAGRTAGQYKTEETKEVKDAGEELKEKKADRKAEPDRDKYIHEEEVPSAGIYHADGKKDEERCCTVNTDKVDAEIRKLKDKMAELERQAAQEAENPGEREKIERELSQVQNELKEKDNDAYRRQGAEVTNAEEG